MIRRWLGCLLVVLLASGGCLWEDLKSDFNRFGSTKNVPVATPDNLPKGAIEAATRVDSVGSRILAANKDIGIRPAFLSFGVPDLSLFHQGTMKLCISEGLVSRCKTDDELAAVLCAELGKMVAEAQVQRTVGRTDRDPSLAPRASGDVVGSGSGPDMTRQAELGYWEKQNPRPRGGDVFSGKNPGDLSRQYLNSLNIDPNLLVKVDPLLRLAEANPKYEKSINGSPGGAGNP
jgi:hypothetical protein